MTAPADPAPIGAPPYSRRWHRGACATLVALLVFMVLREAWIAPLRPGGSSLVLKVVPLALALPGVWRARVYTVQWAMLLVWLYIAFALVSAWSDATASARFAGTVEAALGLGFFACAAAFLRPYKRLARAAARAREDDAPASKRAP